MSEPILGEVRLFSFATPPSGWALCDGAIIQINDSTKALFSLLGTTYGGNGETTFALPDFRGRTPIGFNDTFPLGAVYGEAIHTLTVNEIPIHTHGAKGTGKISGGTNIGANDVFGASTTNIYAALTAPFPLIVDTVATAGLSKPHNNMMPSLSLNFCIAVQGIYPSRP
jgi:microcystin-dependent protein